MSNAGINRVIDILKGPEDGGDVFIKQEPLKTRIDQLMDEWRAR